MANDDHVIRAGYAVGGWNRWRDEHPEITPDLSGADLTGARLEKANLEGANLAGVKMTNAKLQKADLSSATGLTAQMIADAVGDGTTRLPHGVERPATWPDADEEEA